MCIRKILSCPTQPVVVYLLIIKRHIFAEFLTACIFNRIYVISEIYS